MDPFEFADIAVGMLHRESETGSSEERTAVGIPQKVSGFAETDSADGYVMVDLGGSSVTEDGWQAVEMPCDISVKAGDEVAVEIVGGKPRVVGRIGWGDELQTIADDAYSVATATNQHFWADGNGAHVSTDANDPEGASNSLWNSLGLLIRKATNYLVSITQSAIAFYDGQGNDAENIVAQFGSSGATIGYPLDFHMEQDGTGATWYGQGGTTPLIGVTTNNGLPMFWVRDTDKLVGASSTTMYVQNQLPNASPDDAEVRLIAGAHGATASLGVSTADSGDTLSVFPDGIRVYGSAAADDFNGFRGRVSLASTDSIDALYATGIYYTGSGGVGGTLPSGVAGTYCSVICTGNANETSGSWIGKQLLISGSSVYVRSYSGNPRSWGAWVELVTSSISTSSPSITNATATTFETRRQGNVVNLSVYQLKVSASLADGSSVSLGTGIIGADARPTNVVYLPLVANVSGKGAGVLMSIGTTGNVTVYNRSGSSLGTGTNLMGNTSWVI